MIVSMRNIYDYHHYYLIIFILLFFFTCAAAGDHLSINCGSVVSTALRGREWVGDYDVGFSIKGSSVVKGVQKNVAAGIDPVPYNTARISTSPFSYTFHQLGSPGQKLIRLHFNPFSFSSTNNDFFTVEVGPFTLLSNFSPSITARALALPIVVKEFCLITTIETQSLNIIFSPTQQLQKHTYAFINGLEVISLPSSAALSYCQSGDIGVVGQMNSVVHLDHTTALETIHRLNVKWDPVPSGIMFGMWATLLKQKVGTNNNITWKIPVDVGFRYLVRLHFSHMGIKADKDYFVLFINHIVATTASDILKDQAINLNYNYIVMMQGDKRVGKRDISISLCSEDEFVDGHIPLEGFEIFKLSNHDNSLASPNPLPPPTKDSSSLTTNNILVSVLGWRNVTAAIVITMFCLLSAIVHMLRQNWCSQFTEEGLDPKTKAKRLCRHFSLSEIKSATGNFYEMYVIGKGGFGKVYKGLIDNDEEIVAIKRLKSDSRQGKREFWTEVEILSELSHVNLVSLIGYCNERQEMILVYNYMPRGTLADHLYKLARKNNVFSPLSWKQRLTICIGVSRGLDYLHTGHGIIHRDVKSSNILLDEKFIAKISDFGLAKMENGSGLQRQDSANLKGTTGYFDPDYYKTRKLTTKSDVYSFGVVLLEVLCGRRAVDPLVEEDKRSLTTWARDKISQGEVEQIVDQSLRGEISTDSLKAFVRVTERCLHDEPRKRPSIVKVIIRLEFALKQQLIAESLVPNEITSVSDFFPSNGIAPQQEKANSNETTNVVQLLPQGEIVEGTGNSLVLNEVINGSDGMACDAKTQEKEKSWLPDGITGVSNALPRSDKTRFLLTTKLLTMASSKVKNVATTLKGQNFSNVSTSAGKRDGRKRAAYKLFRILPWKAFSTKPSNKMESASVSGGINELGVAPNLRIFSLFELKVSTRNFSRHTVLGEGGFGTVFKGRIHEKLNSKNECISDIAVKKLNFESFQGFKEWQSEVNFLGKLSHPNLVKLIGYCQEDSDLMLVYELMQKGSLETHLFKRRASPTVDPLPWDIRLKIITGAAHGLAFLHASSVIHRDFKPSNILLDESYNAKLSDFGLAKMGPTGDHSHVSTQVIGTNGYAAPEYVATGHLSVKSDVYSFGVILVEMLTGLRAIDKNRPSGQHHLVGWIKPYLCHKKKLKSVIDSRLEERYDPRLASRIAKLASICIGSDPKSRPSMQEVVETLEKT